MSQCAPKKMAAPSNTPQATPTHNAWAVAIDACATHRICKKMGSTDKGPKTAIDACATDSLFEQMGSTDWGASTAFKPLDRASHVWVMHSKKTAIAACDRVERTLSQPTKIRDSQVYNPVKTSCCYFQ